MTDTVKRQKGRAEWQKEQKCGKKCQSLGDEQKPVPTSASRLPFDQWRGFGRAVSYGWCDMSKKKKITMVRKTAEEMGGLRRRWPQSVRSWRWLRGIGMYQGGSNLVMLLGEELCGWAGWEG